MISTYMPKDPSPEARLQHDRLPAADGHQAREIVATGTGTEDED